MKKYHRIRNYLCISALGITICACNGGGGSSQNNLYLSQGLYNLHYSFESSADEAICSLSGYKISDRILISDGNGSICYQDDNGCLNNVNYLNNPCYYNSIESINNSGKLETITEWQNCNFTADGGSATLKYAKFQIIANVPFPLPLGCTANLTLTKQP